MLAGFPGTGYCTVLPGLPGSVAEAFGVGYKVVGAGDGSVDSVAAKMMLPRVNIFNHPLLLYQLGLVPLFLCGTTVSGMIQVENIEEITQAEVIACAQILSMFAAVALLALYTGVSIYSLIFSLPNPAYNGGKWTPFRGGIAKVIQEIVLNVLNMNLMYWVLYLLGEYMEFRAFLEGAIAPADAATFNSTEKAEL